MIYLVYITVHKLLSMNIHAGIMIGVGDMEFRFGILSFLKNPTIENWYECWFLFGMKLFSAKLHLLRIGLDLFIGMNDGN